MALDVVQGIPISRRKTGKITCSHCCRLRNLRTDYLCAKDVGLELHHQVVSRSAAVDFEFGQLYAGIMLHGIDNIHCLESDTFERRACNMRRRRASGQAADGTLCVLVPIRSTETCQCRYEIYSSVVRDRHGQAFDLRRRLYDAETVSKPLDYRTSHEDAALKCIIDRIADFPGDGGEQIV